MSEKNSQGARSQGPRSTSKTTKMIGLILAIVQFVVFVFILQPTEQLTQQALNCIATFLLFLICSLFGVVEMVVIGPICCVLLVLTKTYTLNEILATGFGSNTVWFIVFAFALTAAVNKTGVLKRFVFKLMTFFPETWGSQVTAFMLSGFILNPVVPSGNAKVTVLAPMTEAVAKQDGYENLFPEHYLHIRSFLIYPHKCELAKFF